jgi:hypothetical protein
MYLSYTGDQSSNRARYEALHKICDAHEGKSVHRGNMTALLSVVALLERHKGQSDVGIRRLVISDAYKSLEKEMEKANTSARIMKPKTHSSSESNYLISAEWQWRLTVSAVY